MAKKLLLCVFFLLLYVGINAQCDIPAPGIYCDPEHPSGLGSPILCSLDTLDGYCATMPSQNVGGGPTPNLCQPCGGGNCGIAHNTSWFAFVAGTTTVDMVINPFNCDTIGGGGGGPLTGIQAGIYEDCSFNNSVVCQPSCFPDGSPLNLSSDDFIIGETYFVFIDGCGGSTCQYTIDILFGGDPFEISDPFDITCDLGVDCIPICTGALAVPFTLWGITGTDRYNWTIDPPTPEYPSGEINDESQTVSLSFSESGTYTICANGFHDCDLSDSLCIQVDVAPLGNEVFEDYYVCENDFPTLGPQDEDPNGDGLVGWQGGLVPFAGNYFTTLLNAAGCEYEQELHAIALPLPPRENVDTVFCGFPPVFYEGETFVQDEFGLNMTLEDRAANGCDSLISLYLSILNAGGSLVQGPCLNGEIFIEFDGWINNSNGGVTEYLWTDENGNEVTDGDGNPTILTIDQSGTYTLEIILTKSGRTCNYIIGSLEIDFDDFLPGEPQEQDWNLTPCENDMQTYTVLPDPDPNTAFVWLVPTDATIVSGQGTTDIVIDWSGSNGGQVCVSGFNNCGEGPTVCFLVDPTETPSSSFAADDIICIDNSSMIEYTGNAAAGSDYTWNFGGGTILNGTDGEGPGPHEVNWDTDGSKVVSLVVTENGCASDFFIDSINVANQIPEPIINCNSNTTSITFTWTDVLGADSYTVDVIQGGTGTMDGNSYTIDNLVPGDSITITVEAVSSGPCGNSISIETECFAQNCNLPMITLDSPVDSICVDELNDIDIDVIFDPDPPSGTGVWSGNGISDSDNGIFDPQLAGVGTHILTYVYTENSCTSTLSQTIVVNSIPTADFTANDTICLTETTSIVYTGNASDGNFNWNFDVGLIQSGTGSGPYEISWDSPGNKMISLDVERDNCLSSQVLIPVFVEDTLPPLIIDCEELIDGINFSWNTLPGVTEYEIFIDGNPSGSQTGNTFSVTGLMPGDMRSISVVAVNSGRCANKSSSINCSANSCPPVDIMITPGDTSICLSTSSASIDLDSLITGGFQDGSGLGVWLGPGTDLFTGVFTPQDAGEGIHEIVFGYDENNCADETSIFITVLPTPTSDFTIESPICVTESALIEYTGSSSLAGDFSWNLSGGNIAGANPGPFSAEWSTPGIFDVTLIIDDVGCVSPPVVTQVVVEPELEAPVINCSPSTNQVEFSWNNIDCASSYDVYIDDGSGTGLQLVGNQTNTDISVSGLFPGDVIDIQVVAVTDCECPSSMAMVSCEARQCPAIDLLIDPVEGFCFSEVTNSFFLNADAIGSSGSGNGFWSGLGVNSNGRFFPDIAGIGSHWIRFDWNEDNCNYNDSIRIDIFADPFAEFAFFDPTCPQSNDGAVTIEANGGNGVFSYWINNVEYQSNIIQDLSSGSYVVEVRDGNNCSYSETITLINPAEPTLDIDGNTVVISGTQSTLSVTTDIDPASINQIIWTQSGNEICNGDCFEIPIEPLQGAEYCARIIYNDLCEIFACVDVRVQVDDRYYIPTAFSPNGDGVNDNFTIFTDNKAEQINYMRIFDRWGEMVFETSTPFPTDDISYGWDGKYNTKEIHPGVYVFVAELQYAPDELLIISGDITLVK